MFEGLHRGYIWVIGLTWGYIGIICFYTRVMEQQMEDHENREGQGLRMEDRVWNRKWNMKRTLGVYRGVWGIIRVCDSLAGC